MTAPVSLPASGSTSWYSHYTQLDTLTRRASQANVNRVAFLGDSITALNSTGDNVTSFEGTHDNYSSMFPVLTNGRAVYARSFATGGLALSELRDTVLPRLLARPTAELPGTCVILGGTNDAGQAAGTFNASASISALTDIITSLRNALIRPVLCTLPPRGDSSTANQNAQQLNVRIGGLARTQGLPLVDLHSVLADGSTGGYLTAYNSGDGVHPNPAGMMAMAQEVVDAGVESWLPPWSPYLVRAANDPVDLGSGWGLFLTDSNADGLADNWSSNFTDGGVTVTNSRVTPTAGDGNLGMWQRFTRAAAGGTGTAYYQKFVTSGFVVGDLLSLDLNIRWAGISGSGITTGGSAPRVAISFRDSGNNPLDSMEFGCSRDIAGVVHLERRVPTSTSYALLDMAFPGPTSGTATYDIGQVTVRNLTALGLA